MSEKKYLDLEGLTQVANNVNTRLKTVTTMPETAAVGAIRLYVGEDTADYEKGHVYQYHTGAAYCYKSEGLDIYLYLMDATPTLESIVYFSDNNPIESLSQLTPESNPLDSVGVDSVVYDGTTYVRYSEYDFDGSEWEDLSKAIPEYQAIGFGAPDYLLTIQAHHPSEPLFIITGGPYGDGRYNSNITKAFGCFINDGSARNDSDTWAVYDGTKVHIINVSLYNQSWSHTVHDIANPAIEDNLLFKRNFMGGSDIPDGCTVITSPEVEDNEYAAGAIVHVYPAGDDTLSQISTDGTGLYVKTYCSVGDLVYKGYDYSPNARLIGYGVITESSGGDYTWVDMSGGTHTFSYTDKQTPQHRYAMSVGSVPSMILSTSNGSSDWHFTTLYLGETTENFTTGHVYRREYGQSGFYWEDITPLPEAIPSSVIDNLFD